MKKAIWTYFSTLVTTIFVILFLGYLAHMQVG
jgi:hypothetical protein